MRRCLIQLIALGAVIGLASGCAVFNKQNTPLLNEVREHTIPKDRELNFFTLPLVVLVGTVAGTIDAVIVHPALVIDDAAGDTNDFLKWDARWRGHYFTQSALVIPKSAVTPVVYLTAYIRRAVFDVDPRPSDQARQEAADRERQQKINEIKRFLQRAREWHAQSDYSHSLAITDIIMKSDYEGYNIPEILEKEAGILHLKNLLGMNDAAGFKGSFDYPFLAHAREWFLDDEFKQLLEEVILKWPPESKTPIILSLRRFPDKETKPLLTLALSDSEAVVRYAALEAAIKTPMIKSVIRKARFDPDDIIRLKANQVLDEN